MQYWIKLFEKNIYFNVIRTTGRLLGTLVFFTLFFFGQVNFDICLFIAFTTLILNDIFFFYGMHLKESSYKKARYFFQKTKISPKRIDVYDRWFTIARLIAFSFMILGALNAKDGFFEGFSAGPFIWTVIGYPLSRALAYFSKYKPMMATTNFTPSKSNSPINEAQKGFYEAPYSDFTVFGTEGLNKSCAYTGIGDTKFL